VVNNLLVGFKFIAEVLWQLESTGKYEDATGTPADFIIGTEESHGVLAMPQLRDKDAGAAALLLAELALDCKRRGLTVGQQLDAIYKQFGYFKSALENIVMTGIEGKQNMAKMLDKLRSSPPKVIGGLPVTGFEDLRDENGRMGPLKGATDAAGRNVLLFQLGENARIALRPSGTEPKAKAYVEACSAPCAPGTAVADWEKTCKAVDETAKRLAEEFRKMALATVD
jgi:phosphoglucomutase